MKTYFQPLRIWWQKQTGEDDTPLDGDTPAWIISLFVHLAVLAILTAGTLYTGSETPTYSITSTPVEEVIEPETLEIAQEFAYSDQQVEAIGANSMNGTGMALASAQIESEFSEVASVSLEEPLKIDEVGDVAFESLDTATKGPNMNERMVVKGAQGVGATGASGAIDRITHEIILSLEQRPTLVVWLFDKSGSLARQREEVIRRFDRIYKELGVVESSGSSKAFAKRNNEAPLLTSIVAFGHDVQLLTPKPTVSMDEISSAVNSIVNDESGVERVFSTVNMVADKYKQFRTMQEGKRNVMIVIFSDEAGDDQESVDMVVNNCRRYQMPVYVVGVPAPFGRQEVQVKFVDPDPAFSQEPQWIDVRQGPETFYPEIVKLRFSGEGKGEEPIDSGFGPYALTRLCYETGGIYFAVHPNRKEEKSSYGSTAVMSAYFAKFFDPMVMRKYRPDYMSLEEYKKLVGENKARAALLQAAQLSGADSLGSPRLSFPKRDEASLANMLSDAQRGAAIVEPKLDRLYQTLVIGEKDRSRLTGIRWQAGYDLAMGRTLASSVRAKGYNLMLAKAKQGMRFQDPKSDTWVLKASEKVDSSSVLEKQAAQAKVYLERVVAEHPGTPWEYFASRELQEPFGWEWKETYTGVNAPRDNAGGNGGAPNPQDDKRRMLEKPKPTRKPKL